MGGREQRAGWGEPSQVGRAREQDFVLRAAGSRRQVDILQDGFPSPKCQGSVLAF